MSPENQPERERLAAWFAPPLLWTTGPLTALMAAYSWHLGPEWRDNPDLSHGFFTPLLFCLLLAESRQRGPWRWLPAGRGTSLAAATATAAAVVLFGLAGLLSASVGWRHVLVEFVLSASLAAALFGGLLVLAGDPVRRVPFNWTALTAAGLWLLSAPLPSGTYARLTVLLQGWVTTGVLEALQLLGVPAQQHGNVIELASTSVGVAEACSGIRSLLGCLYAGLFFAAWQVRTPGRRAVLIVAAPLLALVMNFVRSLTLTLMANAGRDIRGFWHDATGFAVLGVTALVLAALAAALGPVGAPADGPPAGPSASTPKRFRTPAIGMGGIAVLATIFWIYAPSAAPAGRGDSRVADLLPARADGWQVVPATDLYQFSDVLRTTQLAQSTYLGSIGGEPCQLTVYVAHWNPGQVPVSLVASHTPDACWPGAGWVSWNDPETRTALMLDGRVLPAAEHRVFVGQAGHSQQVWFWHLYDGRVISYRDPYSVPALLSLAWRYGFRREGEQSFVRVSSNLPWSRLEGDPLVRQIFGRLAPLGLRP